MIHDRLQYCLEHCWIDQKCDQIWTIGPRNQNTWKHKENYDGNLFETYHFHIREYKILNYSEGARTYCFGICCVVMCDVVLMWNLKNRKFGTLKLWHFWMSIFESLNLKNWNMQFGILEILKFSNVIVLEKLKFIKRAPDMMQNPAKQIKTLDMNFISIKNMKWKCGHFCIFK